MSRPTDPDRHPMPLTDQRGRRAYAWFPEGTPTTPAHVLPAAEYAAVCRLRGADEGSPWVAFRSRPDALAALAAARQAAARCGAGADPTHAPT